MKKLIFAALLLTSPAFAANVTVSWTHPTEYEDASALPLASIKETRIQYGSCTTAVPPAFDVAAGTVVVAAPDASTVIGGLSPGTYCFRALTVDIAGMLSVWSNVVSKTITAPRPKAPVVKP